MHWAESLEELTWKMCWMCCLVNFVLENSCAVPFIDAMSTIAALNKTASLLSSCLLHATFDSSFYQNIKIAEEEAALLDE